MMSSTDEYGALVTIASAALAPIPLMEERPRRIALPDGSIAQDTDELFTQAGRIGTFIRRVSLTYWSSFVVPTDVSSSAEWNWIG